MRSEVDLEAGDGLQSATHTASTQNISAEQEPDYFQTLVQTALNGHSKLTYGYLSFDILHKLVLLNHQHKLSLHVRDIIRDRTFNETQIKRIDEDLHNYRSSMEDYLSWRQKDQSWLLEAVKEGRRDKSSEDEAIKLEELSEAHLTLLPELKDLFALDPQLGKPCDVWIKERRHSVQFASAIGKPRFMALRWIGGSWSRDSESVALRNRFAVAIVGGLALIVPMLIMVLCKSLTASLVTVSVSVSIFAIAMAAWPLVFRYLPWVRRWRAAGGDEASHQFRAKEVLFVTAAYAAVLVVFVGTNSS